MFRARKITHKNAGEPCRKCGTLLVEKSRHGIVPPRKARAAYYFNRWLKCPKCRANYMIESEKRFWVDDPTLDLGGGI